MKRPATKRTLTKSTARFGRRKTPTTTPTRATGSEALVNSTSPKVHPKWVSKNVEEDLENKGAVERAHIGPAHSIRGPAPGALVEAAEAGEEPPEAEAKDEALWRVYSPPGKHLHRASGGKRGGGGGTGGGI